MCHKHFLLTTLVISSMWLLGCKPKNRSLMDSGSTLTSAIGDLNVKPDHLSNPLIFTLICENKDNVITTLGGNINEAKNEIIFQKAGAVKTGDSCRMEAWGEISEAYEYTYGVSKNENKSQYLASAKAPVSQDRKVKINYVKAYKLKEVIDPNITTTLQISGLTKFANGIGTLNCAAADASKIEKSASVNEGTLILSFKDEEFKSSEKIRCNKLSVHFNSEDYTYDGFIDIIKNSNNTQAESIDSNKLLKAQPIKPIEGNEDSTIEKYFDGIFSAKDCEEVIIATENEKFSKRTEITISTDNNATMTLTQNDKIYNGLTCEGEGKDLIQIYTVYARDGHNDSPDHKLAFRADKKNSDIQLYGLMSLVEGRLSFAKTGITLNKSILGEVNESFSPSTTEGGTEFTQVPN